MFILLCVTLEDIYHSTRTLFVAVQFENLNPENVVRCWTVVNRLESMRSSGASMRRNSPLTGQCTTRHWIVHNFTVDTNSDNNTYPGAQLYTI